MAAVDRRDAMDYKQVAAALRCSGAVRQMFCESDLLAVIYAVRHGVAVVEAPR